MYVCTLWKTHIPENYWFVEEKRLPKINATRVPCGPLRECMYEDNMFLVPSGARGGHRRVQACILIAAVYQCTGYRSAWQRQGIQSINIAALTETVSFVRTSHKSFGLFA